MNRRDLYFAFLVLASAVLFARPLGALLRLSYTVAGYSHAALIPIATIFLVYLERRKIFADVEYCLGTGAGTIAAGLVGFYAVRKAGMGLGQTDRLALLLLALIVVWVGAFIGCYGRRALGAATFPALFLLLTVPPPDFLLNRAVVFLQKGSTITTYALFRLVGVPVSRQGFVFSLPGFDLKVARECSGIRSSIGILITAIVAGHFFLRSKSRKVLLGLAVIPVTIFKNAVRIATIALLSAYVDQGFLTGKLHHYSGIPFSAIAVLMLGVILWGLQKSEGRMPPALPQENPAISRVSGCSQRPGHPHSGSKIASADWSST